MMSGRYYGERVVIEIDDDDVAAGPELGQSMEDFFFRLEKLPPKKLGERLACTRFAFAAVILQRFPGV